MGEALQKLSENSDNDAVHLMHTAEVIRSELFSRLYRFTGLFGGAERCENIADPCYHDARGARQL